MGFVIPRNCLRGLWNHKPRRILPSSFSMIKIFFFSLSETHLGFLVKQIFYTVAPCAWMSAWFSATRKRITTGRHPGEAWPTAFDWGFQRDFSPWTREAKFYGRKKYLYRGKSGFTRSCYRPSAAAHSIQHPWALQAGHPGLPQAAGGGAACISFTTGHLRC